MLNNFHDAFGVYGIIHQNGQILVIKKIAGPYINRYDLPGGSQESGESLADTLIREIEEETAIIAEKFQQIGITNFIFPWIYEDKNMNNHLAVFYNVNQFSGKARIDAINFDVQDSLGALWLPLSSINSNNASLPLLKAKDFLENNKFNSKSWRLKHWEVLEKPVYGASFHE